MKVSVVYNDLSDSVIYVVGEKCIELSAANCSAGALYYYFTAIHKLTDDIEHLIGLNPSFGNMCQTDYEYDEDADSLSDALISMSITTDTEHLHGVVSEGLYKDSHLINYNEFEAKANNILFELKHLIGEIKRDYRNR